MVLVSGRALTCNLARGRIPDSSRQMVCKLWKKPGDEVEAKRNTLSPRLLDKAERNPLMPMATRAEFSEAWKKLGVRRKARKKQLAVLRLWFGRLRRKGPEIRSADEAINQENMSCRPWPRHLFCCPAAREAPNGKLVHQYANDGLFK